MKRAKRVVGTLLCCGSLALFYLSSIAFDCAQTFALFAPKANFSPAQNVEAIWTGHSYAFVVITPHQKEVALIDAGSDPDAGAIRAHLASQGRSLDDIDTVILTHGHRAHTAGLSNMHGARVYVNPLDTGLVSGQQAPKRELLKLRLRFLGRPKSAPELLPALPGQVVVHGQHRLILVGLPGHTAGSLGVLVGGGLIAGDALLPAKKGLPAQRAMPTLLNESPIEAQKTAQQWQTLVLQASGAAATAAGPNTTCCSFIANGHTGVVPASNIEPGRTSVF